MRPLRNDYSTIKDTAPEHETAAWQAARKALTEFASRFRTEAAGAWSAELQLSLQIMETKASGDCRLLLALSK